MGRGGAEEGSLNVLYDPLSRGLFCTKSSINQNQLPNCSWFNIDESVCCEPEGVQRQLNVTSKELSESGNSQLACFYDDSYPS